MVAFVGYVNALVVENGILQELPRAILTQDYIMTREESVLDKIAGERPSEARQREEAAAELAALEEAERTLRAYTDGQLG